MGGGTEAVIAMKLIGGKEGMVEGGGVLFVRMGTVKNASERSFASHQP